MQEAPNACFPWEALLYPRGLSVVEGPPFSPVTKMAHLPEHTKSWHLSSWEMDYLLELTPRNLLLSTMLMSYTSLIKLGSAIQIYIWTYFHTFTWIFFSFLYYYLYCVCMFIKFRYIKSWLQKYFQHFNSVL